MVDITHKTTTLRIATAQAIVKVGSAETINRIQEGTVPKGDVLAMSKAAGLLGIKKTPDILPDCHPLPIEYTGIEYILEEDQIQVLMTVKTIYKTGVEVEAMHGASVVALNMYDMLKPIDKQVEIHSIKLLKKTGGKSDFKSITNGLTAHIIVCSDSIYSAFQELNIEESENLVPEQDKSGQILLSKMQEYGLNTQYSLIPDHAEKIKSIVQNSSADIILFSGGTGVGPKDLTPNVIEPLLTMRLLGLEEEMRRYGQERMHYAMLSRSLAGLIGQSLVLSIPGSSGAAKDCLSAIFPYVFHIFHIMKGGGH